MVPYHQPLTRLLLLLVVGVGLVGCNRGPDPVEEATNVSLAPAETVAELLGAIDDGRFEDAAGLTDTTQAALITLAEGADASDVVSVLETDPEQIAANFWSGFAQTLESEFDPAQATITAAEPVQEGSSTFLPVSVTLGGGEEQTLVLRDAGGWKIDLLATFGPILAERLIAPVEAILSSANADAATVLRHLNDSADSLRLVAADPGLAVPTHQSLLALIERITRAGG